MIPDLYLERTLLSDGKYYTESELLDLSNYIVVLAEPGAGKTELLNSFARKLGSSVVTANAFKYMGSSTSGIPLVIDAFDELAKVEEAGIFDLLATAVKAHPTKLILSSRSSEWDSSATRAFNEFFHQTPLVVRLADFSDTEQQQIYDSHTGRSDFLDFKFQLEKHSLELLLPNPQFLKLFADAYIESSGHFESRRSIFTQAINHLAKEANPDAKPDRSFSYQDKVELASEVFAKLLLSGVEGISVSEVADSEGFANISTFVKLPKQQLNGILATKLFKPANGPDHHVPIHKIVAEYCSASYLIKKITSPLDSLTLAECLTVIAPNGASRTELRGLLGWMAALGNKDIQQSIIEVDPYAVIANGDPSQLEPVSKLALLSRLEEVEKQDPYFRRGDQWRTFNAIGFFSEEVAKQTKQLLIQESHGHLQGMILELLVGSPSAKWLTTELAQLMMDSSKALYTRDLALKCLLGLDRYECTQHLIPLIEESSNSSLSLAAFLMKERGIDNFEQNQLVDFLKSCSALYPGKRNLEDRIIGQHYFIEKFISELSLNTIEYLLDTLTHDLQCTCGKKPYECYCRTGISKIVGKLLDRYFENATPPFEPIRIWNWLRNLNYPDQTNPRDFKSVDVLQKNSSLRQSILSHVLGSETEKEKIHALRTEVFSSHCHSHSGLAINLNDVKHLIDIAFENGNVTLWIGFSSHGMHYPHHAKKEDKGPNLLRRHMRAQSRIKPDFMRAWTKRNKAEREETIRQYRVWGYKNFRSSKRYNKRQANIRTENLKYFKENRESIAQGRDWGCLRLFADFYLNKPEAIESEIEDVLLVNCALTNCLSFLDPELPDLEKLAKLQSESKGLLLEKVLFASLLKIFREKGRLDDIESRFLLALRTNLNMGYRSVSKEECDALKKELDRILFPTLELAEKFLRDYLEPQLAAPTCAHPEVELLKYDEIFWPLRSKLSIEWLNRFPELQHSPLDTLFKLAAKHADKESLNTIIKNRCSKILNQQRDKTDDNQLDQHRDFWFLRALYFLSPEESRPYWDFLKGDKAVVLLLERSTGRLFRGDDTIWPTLSASKIESILDAFFVKWPKVELPQSHGTDSPKKERAYRFLTDIVWDIGKDRPDHAIPVLKRMIADSRYSELCPTLKAVLSDQIRHQALDGFIPPSSSETSKFLNDGDIVTVEGLRRTIIQELATYQKDIDGGEFNARDRFYTIDKQGTKTRIGELKASEIVAERLDLLLKQKNITIVKEHETQSQNRIDITAAKVIDGKRRLLVIEAKGQWHKELYIASSAQLYDRYSCHPDAENQGIYLVFWFGPDEKVANRKFHGISNADELKESIEIKLKPELKGLIDVFVLDLSDS